MRRALLLAAGCLVLATGCRTVPQARPLPADDPRPEAFVSRMRDRAGERLALRGEARLAIDGATGSTRARQRIAVERPGRLRVEIVGLFDQVAAILATDGTTFDLWNAKDASLETGLVNDTILAETAGLGLTPTEAVDVILGAPQLPAAWRPAGATFVPDGPIFLYLQDERGVSRWRVGFDPVGRLRELRVLDEDQGTSWVARWSDYREVEGEDFAFAITLEFPATAAEAEIDFLRVELNPELPESIFRIRPRIP